MERGAIDSKSSRKVLVVGGGIAGLSSARHLSHLGLKVIMVEKNPYIGGQALNFFCKATDTCQKCNYCLVEECLPEVLEDPNIEVLTHSELVTLNRNGNQTFAATILKRPAYIDPSRCNNCGICFEMCPAVEDGAIVKGLSSSVTHPLFGIDEANCLYFKDPHARLCQDNCPQKAIDLDRKPEELVRQVEAVVLATGYQPFDPHEKPRLGYGTLPNVITAMELERMLRLEGKVLRPSDHRPPRRIAFIQCVGSRDATLNHLFCSRVCCGYALRIGKALKHRWPETDLFVFYMDIQNFGKDFISQYEAAREVLTLVRAVPGSINPAPEGGVTLVYQEEGGGMAKEEVFDLLVLSVGIMPHPQNETWAKLFSIEAGLDGFLPQETARGVFTAGTLTGPMDIAQSAADGARAARLVAGYLGVKVC